MATISWINPTGGDWSLGLNWDGGQVPTASDDAVLTLSTTMTITISTIQQAHAITLQGVGASYSITAPGRLDVATDILMDDVALRINGGTLVAGGDVMLSMTGALAFGGGAEIRAGGTIALTGNDIVDLGNIGVVTAGSTITQMSNGGTLTLTVSCFAAGTRLATTNGPHPVEDLSPDDHVQLADGGSARIVWIGRVHIDCRRHPNPASVLPVRVQRDAFAPGIPCRDLLLSPDHGIFPDGVLIPVHRLVNGGSVAVAPL